jgi:hypothetical protein
LPIDFVSMELADGAAADEFVATGTLSLAAPDDAVAPSALLTIKLNGTEIRRAEVKSASRRLDGAMTQFGYVFGPIKIEGEGRIDADLTFGNSGPTASDHLSLLSRR